VLQKRDAYIVGYYAPAAGTREEEGLGRRDGAEHEGPEPVGWKRQELRPHDRSRCAEHGEGGARPTGGSHGRTARGPAQR